VGACDVILRLIAGEGMLEEGDVDGCQEKEVFSSAPNFFPKK